MCSSCILLILYYSSIEEYSTVITQNILNYHMAHLISHGSIHYTQSPRCSNSIKGTKVNEESANNSGSQELTITSFTLHSMYGLSSSIYTSTISPDTIGLNPSLSNFLHPHTYPTLPQYPTALSSYLQYFLYSIDYLSATPNIIEPVLVTITLKL